MQTTQIMKSDAAMRNKLRMVEHQIATLTDEATQRFVANANGYDRGIVDALRTAIDLLEMIQR